MSQATRNPWATWNTLLNAQALGESTTNIMDRLLFASGWPAQSPSHAIERLYSLNSFAQGSNLPTVPRATIRSIIERDTLTALGIELPPGRTGADTTLKAALTLDTSVNQTSNS